MGPPENLERVGIHGLKVHITIESYRVNAPSLSGKKTMLFDH